MENSPLNGEQVRTSNPQPSRWASLTLAGVLFGAYVSGQIVIAGLVMAWMIASGQVDTPEALLQSRTFIWGGLVGIAVGAVATILIALVWPWAWRLLTSRHYNVDAWLGWNPASPLPLWSVPLLTLPFMIAVTVGVSLFTGPAEVNVQLQLFETKSLQIATSLVVTSIVPLAEELIFRGALYQALLAPAREGVPGWRRQILPLVVTSVSFAAIHLLAGFETFAAILQILILSFYLGSLRAITGSVKGSLVGHVTWNLVSAVALTLATNLT